VKIQLLSDLHLERQPGFEAEAVPGVDVLVLAGDIGSYQPGSRLLEDDFGLGRFVPGTAGCPWKTVFFVPGNHEYDLVELRPTRERLHNLCRRFGITWLDEEVVVLDGVRFVGSTLWADFDGLAHLEARVRSRDGDTLLTRQLRQREKAFRAANHYLARFSTLRDGRMLMAEDIRELSLECQAWLRGALATPFDGPTVAVTHFAPSLRSHDPRYGITPGTAGFCNALDDLLPLADVWLHGHLHCPSDYVATGVRDGRPAACRVVANPLGYIDRNEHAGFRPGLVIDVPVAPPA